jgi:hypothetical protein
MNAAQRWFVYLLWMIVLVSFSGEIWNLITKKDNTPFFHSYILLEYLMVMQIYKHLFKEHVKSHIWTILSIGFVCVWMGNVLFGEGIWGFPDYIHALEALIILILVFKWFAFMLKEKSHLTSRKNICVLV